jgi:hypothetical protein
MEYFPFKQDSLQFPDNKNPEHADSHVMDVIALKNIASFT